MAVSFTVKQQCVQMQVVNIVGVLLAKDKYITLKTLHCRHVYRKISQCDI